MVKNMLQQFRFARVLKWSKLPSNGHTIDQMDI
jgi:hypothetical protein